MLSKSTSGRLSGPSKMLSKGGRPSKGTPADKRLAANKPKANVKPKAATPKKG